MTTFLIILTLKEIYFFFLTGIRFAWAYRGHYIFVWIRTEPEKILLNWNIFWMQKWCRFQMIYGIRNFFYSFWNVNIAKLTDLKKKMKFLADVKMNPTRLYFILWKKNIFTVFFSHLVLLLLLLLWLLLFLLMVMRCECTENENKND